ncbi:MAG: cupin domain-containing protein [Gemmatimonadetes bacterium]|nr:cupin domain-containing protein [Gemmatimonadota bacterium]
MGVVHKHRGQNGANDWAGVEMVPYTGGGAVGGSVRVVIGPEDGANNFSVRYFEIEPGGQSSFDRHDHDHGIYILRGRAKVLIGWDVHDVSPGDVVYIAPNEQHQFESVGKEPLGFLCVVPPKDSPAESTKD